MRFYTFKSKRDVLRHFQIDLFLFDSSIEDVFIYDIKPKQIYIGHCIPKDSGSLLQGSYLCCYLQQVSKNKIHFLIANMFHDEQTVIDMLLIDHPEIDLIDIYRTVKI